MGCRDFFQANTENKELCRILQAVSPEQQLAWEVESASKHSPGPANSDETISRQVLNPQHFDTVTGTIKPTFFDDASSKGASVNRLAHITVEGMRLTAQSRVDQINANPPASGVRVLIGYTMVTVGEVRSIFADTPQRRALAVYDTAKHDDPSHADICQLISGKMIGKSIRAQLFQFAKSRLIRFA